MKSIFIAAGVTYIVYSLSKRIIELEEKVAELTKTKTPAPATASPSTPIA